MVLWKIGKRYRQNAPWREHFGFCPIPPKGDTPLVWIHTVSVGEAVAAKFITQQLNKDGYRLLLTHTTANGRQWLIHHHPYATVAALPLDLPGAVRRFFTRCKPQLGIIMEAEYWPNLLLTAKEQQINLILANARLGAKTARRYRRIATLMRAMVACFNAFSTQTAGDARRLRCFGAKRVNITGNLKFDAPLSEPQPLSLSSKKTVLLAATRPGEESLLLSAINSEFSRNYLVIIAPRHPERREEIIRILQKQQLTFALRSRQDTVSDDTAVYLADSLGEMETWYASCDAAIIGGSFLPYGGQNPIEAMQAGVATVIGPHTDNYAKIVRRARNANALWQVTDANDAIVKTRQLLQNDTQQMQTNAQTFCRQQRGALDKNMRVIRERLTV